MARNDGKPDPEPRAPDPEPRARPGTGPRAPRRARSGGGDRARRSGADDSAPRLPHERDASADSQYTEPRRVLKQAHDDIEQGQQDTDRRGVRGYEKPENRRTKP